MSSVSSFPASSPSIGPIVLGLHLTEMDEISFEVSRDEESGWLIAC